jgi:hypothetical protein
MQNKIDEILKPRHHAQFERPGCLRQETSGFPSLSHDRFGCIIKYHVSKKPGGDSIQLKNPAKASQSGRSCANGNGAGGVPGSGHAMNHASTSPPGQDQPLILKQKTCHNAQTIKQSHKIRELARKPDKGWAKIIAPKQVLFRISGKKRRKTK